MSKIIINYTVKNYLKAPKIREKLSETLWNKRNPNKVFWSL